MRKKIHSAQRGWATFVGGGLAVAGLLAVAASAASAATSLSATVSDAYSVDKVASNIIIDGSTAVINRTPAIAATREEAEARNTTPPTLSCTSAAGTVTSTGEYVSIDDKLSMFFLFDKEVDAATASCTVGKSTFINSKADTTYPFTAAAQAALTALTVTMPDAYGLDKVISTIDVKNNVAIVTRIPVVTATAAQATTRNATPPTLVCGTATSTGEYASIDDTLVVRFAFDKAIPASIDSCKLTKSDFVNAKADTTYPFTEAARQALWGDPTKTLDDAKARLSGVTKSIRKAFNGPWTGNFAKRIAANAKAYTWSAVNFRFDADSTNTKTMYILRPENHGAFWLNVCQRLADGRLVCMKYHPVSNKKSFTVDSVNKNITTEILTEEVTAS